MYLQKTSFCNNKNWNFNTFNTICAIICHSWNCWSKTVWVRSAFCRIPQKLTVATILYMFTKSWLALELNVLFERQNLWLYFEMFPRVVYRSSGFILILCSLPDFLFYLVASFSLLFVSILCQSFVFNFFLFLWVPIINYNSQALGVFDLF